MNGREREEEKEKELGKGKRWRVSLFRLRKFGGL